MPFTGPESVWITGHSYYLGPHSFSHCSGKENLCWKIYCALYFTVWSKLLWAVLRYSVAIQ